MNNSLMWHHNFRRNNENVFMTHHNDYGIHWLKIQHLEHAFLGYAFVSILSCNLNNKLKFMQIISVHFLIIKQIQ